MRFPYQSTSLACNLSSCPLASPWATAGDAASAPAIRSGDMVVFFEGREAIGFDRMKAKGIWQCRHGAFHHDEIVGKPFGSRVSLLFFP